MSEDLLKIDNLVVSVKDSNQRLVNHLSLTIKRCQSMALVGENGSGKTTVSKAVLGFLPDNCYIQSGRILYSSTDITRLSRRQLQTIRGKKIATIFQNAMGTLTPSMRVGAQIVETLRHHFDMSKEEAFSKARELLESVHIESPDRCLQLYPFELSGGMCQRVSIAIALATNPELIIADEPSTALDSISQAQVLRVLTQIHQNHSTALLLITHNLALVSELCEEMAIIRYGEIVEQGPVQELLHSPSHPYTQQLIRAIPKIPSPSYLSPKEPLATTAY
ncbi:ABC transporter ATP-binding protein [Chlamydia trachomatis]|uniref:Nickel import system ATP-binding protein NikD n=1 Tax=Chlamydia trachomatis serovar D (strain ATCC VR-885 / DSM 19411 / UW-3/Cx) TaxID=272561 RepID=O84204_CHLTR|nr:ABC transporter ATP-binding protein [Chlamydia trachomatis]NP_219705.1 oligopeptide ABC transporter ATP-binding protein [Chlamydia trachomatis D/UW-3/CX]AAC67793.1 Oligopeptide Transport ATPase [Chlamydia trachomatis D/UW-3/CX]ADH17890.1 oligopeptide transport ATPase [Chlamydia trachomatis G/9768]ADH18810.1 oligopeptide transport ATPase [Chlamydia trachomatis G/11222]ADH19737.1 oligopeptide transport ATPase [Chlamydia trachomatis G/11074]ADH20660.1 oligopeptide transport ATPase [Chlamydia 